LFKINRDPVECKIKSNVCLKITSSSILVKIVWPDWNKWDLKMSLAGSDVKWLGEKDEKGALPYFRNYATCLESLRQKPTTEKRKVPQRMSVITKLTG